ncbi:hypothetical protein FHS70_002510 [Flammeovirga yaeyamensis]|nr:hypothetical protein [Flammeovirga yaeyamensis]
MSDEKYRENEFIFTIVYIKVSIIFMIQKFTFINIE